MQGQMGFSSSGLDQGTTFYFELPLYSAASVGLDPEQAARTLLLSQNRLAVSPVAPRRSTSRTSGLHNDNGEGRGNETGALEVAANLFQSVAVEESGSVDGENVQVTITSSPQRKSRCRSDLGTLDFGLCLRYFAMHVMILVHFIFKKRWVIPAQRFTLSPLTTAKQSLLCGSCSW